jgi:Tfp pilus assembly protein PilN
MIKVNLSGKARKKAVKPGAKMTFALPSSIGPIIQMLIVVATIAVGYTWYSSLANRSEELGSQIALAELQKAQLEAVIKEDQIYEQRKKDLENRVRVIEGLQRDQISPVMSLDILSEAIDRTQYVWLSGLDQNNAIFSLTGIGTSVNAIADFVSNLEATRYFRNINLVNAQDNAGNFTFSMTCEFAPPVQTTAVTTQAVPVGGN